ncbi:hypothetical protein [Barrientosiimonas humi]|uniref:hypothetical protein n=1 Tax=Barrientosiimonas humi TaxID=999931 RepID=UPI00370DC65F
MSYSLAFWSGGDALDPQQSYETMNEGRRLDGVDEVSSGDVETALGSLPDWRREGNFLFPPGSVVDEDPAFDVYVGEQMVEITGYSAEGEQMNAIIDALSPLGLRLYDPQTGERFG